MRSKAVVAGSVLSVALLSGGWLMQRGLGTTGAPNAAQSARLLDQVMARIADDYVDTLSQTQLYQKATDGLIGELGDPHTVLLTPDRLAKLQETTTARYAGVGIQIDVRDGWITVVSPLPGTPAQEAGIQTGDRFVQIDGASTKGWTAEEAQKALRGSPGSKVKIVVERPGVATGIPFTLERREIQVHVVRHALMLRDGVGYVDLTTFSENAASDLRNAVDSLRKAGMQTLVFDLRGNPGGLLDQGVAVADLFLDRGQKIVSMAGRTPDADRQYSDGAPQQWPDLRVITLVDSGTASAAEIVAGALQDHDRSVVLGTTTYGKGSAQSVFPVAGGNALKLTTALWYTPSGRSINRHRIVPSDDEGDDSDSGVSPDTGAKAPKFKTDAGRTVLGGGGITPDLIVADSAASAAEKEFERALGKQVPAFRDALADYALSLKAKHALSGPDFAVTPAMRNDFYTELKTRKIDVPRPTYDAASSLVDRLLGSQIERYVFGEQAQFTRDTRDDPTITAALRIATGATSEKQLLDRAAQEAKH